MKKRLHNSLTVTRVVNGFVLLFLLGIAGCIIDDDYVDYDVKHDGYVPVYGTQADLEISFQPARQVVDPGKIYIYGKYLLVNEKNAGIHVFDNEDPAAPKSVGFIRILGSFDMAVRNNTLYAGHFGSISAIDLNSFEDLAVRETLTLDNWNYGVAPPPGEYFDCVDATKGPVVGWERTTSKYFDCYAIR